MAQVQLELVAQIYECSAAKADGLAVILGLQFEDLQAQGSKQKRRDDGLRLMTCAMFQPVVLCQLVKGVILDSPAAMIDLMKDP